MLKASKLLKQALLI